MQVKTIKNVLKQKLYEVAESIDDSEISNIIINNSIVTGGCIASMLLGEPVNDFDIYFDSKENVKKIAEYYINKCLEVSKRNIMLLDGCEKKIDGIDKCAPQLLRAYTTMDNERIKIFFPDAPVLSMSEIVEGYDKSIMYQLSYITANAITLTGGVQFVIRFHGCPEEIHKNYDFVHATNYYYRGNLVLNEPALTSLLTRSLSYIGSKYPICSIIRTKKFIKRGFKINAGEYLKMAYQVSELDLNNFDVLEDQLAGVDAAYFSILIAVLRQQKEKHSDFLLNYSFIRTMLDKIFNTMEDENEEN